MSKQNKAWLRSHVERCLQDIWDVPRVQQDGDGDYAFRGESSACWVRLETKVEPWLVGVFAHAAFGVTPSVKLLRELDEIATGARAVSVFQTGGLVIVRHPLMAHHVDRRSLRYAMDGVSTVADQVGQLVSSVYGGMLPLQPQEAGRV